MEKEVLYKKIEELNLENIEIKSSNEYKIGKKVIKIFNLLKKFKFITIFNLYIKNKKMKKLNVFNDEKNNFCYDKEKLTNKKNKIVVYTCITGAYDNLLEPYIKCDNIDFILYTDNENLTSENWIIKKIPKEISKKYTNIYINRYFKMHPHEFFKEYDFAIYIDGNVKVMSDLTDLIYSINSKTGISMHRHQFRNCIYNEIEACKLKKKGNYKKMKNQIEHYREEGFPKEFGMLEATIIVSDMNNNTAKKILGEWWDEFISTESMRDQISLHYIIWKNGLNINDFGILGFNLYKNPKFRVFIH